MPKTEIIPPSFGELDQVTDLHIKIFEGYIGVRLGRPYIRMMLQWFLERTEHDAIFLSAKCCGQILGYVFGAPLGYSKKLSPRLLLPALYGTIKKPSLIFSSNTVYQIFTRLTSMFSNSTELFPINLPIPIISLVGLGVVPEARGEGVGKLLVNSFREHAYQKNYQSMRLSVYKENDGAIQFYKSLGWKVYDHPGNSELLFCTYVLEKTVGIINQC